MKYFTREWANGDLSPARMQAVERRYAKHLEELLRIAPKSIAQVARVHLHDALICQAEIRRAKRSVLLHMHAGDQQLGYRDVRLKYGGVDLAALDLAVLANRARDRRTEVLYDELDRATDGAFEHRFLFWPEQELTIRFETLEVETSSRKHRAVPFCGDPYRELDF